MDEKMKFIDPAMQAFRRKGDELTGPAKNGAKWRKNGSK